MVVVAMVSVLALLAVYGVRKYISASKATEPIYMVGLIKTSQEAWREEFHVYDNASANIDSYYPDTPDGRSRNFNNPAHADNQAWLNLGVSTPNPVRYGYATVAGAAGAGKPAIGTSNCCNWIADGEPWFIVKAVGDNNGDGNKSIFIGSSQTQEIYAESENE